MAHTQAVIAQTHALPVCTHIQGPLKGLPKSFHYPFMNMLPQARQASRTVSIPRPNSMICELALPETSIGLSV